MGERAGGSAGTHVVHAVEKLAERCGDGGARVLHEDAVADVLEGLVEAHEALHDVLADEGRERGRVRLVVLLARQVVVQHAVDERLDLALEDEGRLGRRKRGGKVGKG